MRTRERRSRTVALALAATMFAGGSAHAQASVTELVRPAYSPAAPATAEADVRAAMTRFLDALNGLDLAGMTALFSETVTAFVPTAQPDRVDGKAAVTAIFRGYVDRARAGRPAGKIVPLDITAEASSSLGVVTFNHRDAAFGAIRRRTFVFRQESGAWRISHFHASDLTALRVP